MTANPTGSPPRLGRHELRNLTPDEFYEHAVRRGEGVIGDGGALVMRTGTHPGRSPMDKSLVDEPEIHDGVWWGGFDTPISIERAPSPPRSPPRDRASDSGTSGPGGQRRGG